jgi:5-methylcytosine-specific restriction endonuclease McrA
MKSGTALASWPNPAAMARSDVAPAACSYTLPVTTDEICEPGYSEFVRRYIDGRTKAEVYREYGLENHPPGAYEIDHLISISLGGSNDIKNLWPQTEYDKT